MDYVAAMNVALAYHKLRDDWRDDRSLPSAAGASIIQSAYRRVEAAWPDKCAAIVQWLNEVHDFEARGLQQPDPPANATGRALGELFVYQKGDFWEDPLRAMGDGIGRFIYLMDAYDDLPQDVKRHRYNPLAGFSAQPDYEDFCRSALTLAVADAARAFELLPVVRDADILRNILYSGIWSKYAAIQKRREDGKKER